MISIGWVVEYRIENVPVPLYSRIHTDLSNAQAECDRASGEAHVREVYAVVEP